MPTPELVARGRMLERLLPRRGQLPFHRHKRFRNYDWRNITVNSVNVDGCQHAPQGRQAGAPRRHEARNASKRSSISLFNLSVSATLRRNLTRETYTPTLPLLQFLSQFLLQRPQLLRDSLRWGQGESGAGDPARACGRRGT